MDRLKGLIVVGAWAFFFGAPFSSFPGMRHGIFIPSNDWNAIWLLPVALGSFIGLLAFAGALAVTLLSLGPSDDLSRWVKSNGFRKALPWAMVTLLLILPFWGWGAERGFIRIWAHNSAPTLGHTTTTAVISSYAGPRPRHSHGTLNVRIPPYGRLNFGQLPDLLPEFQLKKGMELPISGRSTWVGVYYDTLEWPEDWLARPETPTP